MSEMESKSFHFLLAWLAAGKMCTDASKMLKSKAFIVIK
jgi:hypothetical protein